MGPEEERRLRNAIAHYRNHKFDEISISRAIHDIAKRFTNPGPLDAAEVNQFLRREGLPQLTQLELSDPEYLPDRTK